MKKIEQLTPEQQARFAEFRDKWITIGLSCEPLDLERAKTAVAKAYVAAGLAPPTKFIVCDSPVSAAIVIGILRSRTMASVWDSVRASVTESVRASVTESVRASVTESVRASVWASVLASVRASVSDSVSASVLDSVWDSVWSSVWSSVRESVLASVRDSVWSSVRDSVWSSVLDSVWSSVLDSVWASVWSSVRESVLASVRDSVLDSARESVEQMSFGAHDSYWISFYDYFLVACGLHEQCDPLLGLTEVASCCGWWSPYANVAVLQHRHCDLNRDDRGRLHNERGMAVKYRDGWGVYAWHGVRVAADVIERPESITPELIRGARNEEVRRVMTERFGWERWLAADNARLADRRFNERDGQHESLYQLSDGTQRIVLSDPSTGRRYALGVPRNVKTCQQAQAFLSHGLDKLAVHRS